MTATLNFLKLDGTTSSKLQLNAAGTGVVLKNVSGNLVARNYLDAADATITGDEFLASGDTGLVINSNAVGSGADWKISIARPTSGMAADWTLTLPTTPGTVGQVLRTDGAGVTSWIDAASGATDVTIQTALAFGDGASVAVFTLPANGVILSLEMIVDTAFDGTPTASVGVSADHSLFMGSGDLNLGISAGWNVEPNVAPIGSTQAINIYYSAGGASVGAARLILNYAIPA